MHPAGTPPRRHSTIYNPHDGLRALLGGRSDQDLVELPGLIVSQNLEDRLRVQLRFAEPRDDRLWLVFLSSRHRFHPLACCDPLEFQSNGGLI